MSLREIVVVDYGMGNLRSVKQALLHVAPANTHISVSENPTQIANADAIVFPGQGAAKACMNALNNIEGLRESVLTAAQQKPFRYLHGHASANVSLCRKWRCTLLRFI